MTVIPVSFANMAVHPQSPDAIMPGFNPYCATELPRPRSPVILLLAADEVDESESVEDSSESETITLYSPPCDEEATLL